MKVSSLSSQPLILPPAGKDQETVQGKSFGDLLMEKLQDVNRLQNEAESLTEKMVAGEPVELHQVMIATEQASLAMQLTVQIRNKIIEAYQEIARMQV